MQEHAFHHILLVGRSGINGVPETILAVRDFLAKLKVQCSIEKSTADIISNHELNVLDNDEIGEQIDLIIVVGGDGSLLNAAHIAVLHNIPVLGINRGRLGFLTDIYPDELQKIGSVIKGDYQQEIRLMLECSAFYEERLLYNDIALNDVVLMQGKTPQMIEFETSINDRFVCRQRADGLIITTPTGSTAYALSGGGPILHPQLNAVALVPMFPHTLSSRPIVVDASSMITVRINKSNESSPNVSCDGLTRVGVPSGGYLTVSPYKQHLKLIHPTDYSYFTTLREKLDWERHAIRKEE